ncbi:MAG TPA: glycosyltransferase family 4 protein [Rhizomicrobium sp.]|jgi:glycosyltransferase involved in cell wall biosynthesis
MESYPDCFYYRDRRFFRFGAHVKIAFLIPGGVDREGVQNIVPCFLWLIEWLVKNGDEVHVFTLYQERRAAHWKLLGANIHNAGGNHPTFRMLAQFVREHRRSRFQVIQTDWSLKASLVGAAAGKICRIPLLLHLSGGELVAIPDIRYGDQCGLKTRTMFRLAIAASDRVAVVSAPLIEEARSLNITATRLPFGIAIDKWPVLRPKRRTPAAPLRLLHIANIIPVKDHQMLLDMARTLHENAIPFELDMLGQDVTGQNEIQKRMQQLRLPQTVRFHGAVPHSDIRRFYERADVLLVTSRHEAGPLVALEAAIAGLAVVGTKVGHLAEWAPEAACVVEPGDAQGLAAIVSALSLNEDLRLELAHNAQQRALLEDIPRTSRRFRDLYEEMAAS